MTTIEESKETAPVRSLPLWAWIGFPFLLIVVLLIVFTLGNPLALFTADLPPIEQLNFERVRVTETGFQATLVNSGPDPVTVAQVAVDDAYWNFDIQPSNTLPRLGRATLTIDYPWVENEAHMIKAITDTGLTFEAEIALATLTPTP